MERIENKLDQVSSQKERRQAAARLAAARQRDAERNAAYAAFEQRMKERWGVDIKAARLAPPTLTGDELQKSQAVSEKYRRLVIRKGKAVEEIFRRGINGHCAFIDQLTFVLEKETLNKLFDAQTGEQEEIVARMSLFLHEIFGFGVSHDREKSANFYSSSYNLGNYETSYGILCIGGGVNPSNESSLCIELTATGLNAAKDGWEQRLYNFSQMKKVHGFHYTRVDLAHDFLSGEYSVNDALTAYRNGAFTNSFTKPKLRLEGDDWYNETKHGRTLYVGTRLSSRMLRFYEKGKQLGDSESPWVRCELELRSNDLIIPLDVVVHPGDYLSAQYPELNRLFGENGVFAQSQPKKIAIKQRMVQAGIEHSIKYLRMQGSRAINMLLELGKSAEEIMRLFDPDVGVPKTVHPGQYFAELLKIDCISEKFLNPVCGYSG